MNCGGRMELRAVVIRPPATIKVLTSLVEEGLRREPPDFGLEQRSGRDKVIQL